MLPFLVSSFSAPSASFSASFASSDWRCAKDSRETIDADLMMREREEETLLVSIIATTTKMYSTNQRMAEKHLDLMTKEQFSLERFVKSHLLALSANHCFSDFKWHRHRFIAGLYAALNTCTDVPTPTTEANAVSMCMGTQARERSAVVVVIAGGRKLSVLILDLTSFSSLLSSFPGALFDEEDKEEEDAGWSFVSESFSRIFVVLFIVLYG